MQEKEQKLTQEWLKNNQPKVCPSNFDPKDEAKFVRLSKSGQDMEADRPHVPVDEMLNSFRSNFKRG